MRSSKQTFSGFTLVELLVVIAILAMLVALLLPAVQSAREAARVSICKNNLKQLSLAIWQHHDAVRALPPARLMPRPGDSEVCGIGTPTWMIRILPYMEESSLYDQWHLDQTYDSHPDSVRTQTVSSFFCPSRRDAGTSVLQQNISREFSLAARSPGSRFLAWCPDCGPKPPGPDGPTPDPDDPDIPSGENETFSVTYKVGALSDYAANHGDHSPGFVGAATDFGFGGNGTGLIISSRPKCSSGRATDWRDKIRAKHAEDGLSKTFLLGESHVKQGALGVPPVDGPAYDGNHLPSSSRIGGVGFPLAKSLRDNAPTYSFGSWHAGFCQFAMGDGSVRSVNTEIGELELGRLAHRSDGSR